MVLRMKCKICGNDKDNKVFKVKEMMFGCRETFDYFECSQCGCLQIYTIPQNMSKYYPPDYLSFQMEKKSFKEKIKRILDTKRDKFSIIFNGFLGFSYYPDFLSRNKLNFDARILDVGTGIGALPLLLHDIGFSNVMGIDPYINEDIFYENGVTILKKNIHELTEKFDLIIFNHSFEHVPDPYETLSSVSTHLENEGTCIIRIPTVSSFAWKKYGVNWVQLDAPRHFFLYSIESIRSLASKSGLELREYYYDSSAFQFLGSELYLRDIPLSTIKSYDRDMGKFFSKKEKEAFELMAKKLNLSNEGDSVVLYFKIHTTDAIPIKR